MADDSYQQRLRALEDQLQACQAKVQQAEERQRLLNFLPDGYIQFDRELRPTFLNAAGERLYAQIHRSASEAADPSSAAAAVLEKTLLLSVFESSQPVVVEFSALGAAPGAVIEARYFPDDLVSGQARSVLAILRDYTGRKRVFEAQQINEQLIRAALAHVGVKVYTQDVNLSYKWIYDEHFGLLDQAYPGKTDEDFYSPEDTQKLNQLKRQVLESGERARAEMNVVVNGESRTFELLIEPTRGETGQVNGLLCSSLEITERKRTAEELQRLVAENQRQREQLARQNELLQAIFDVDPSGLAVVSGEALTHRYVNPAYRAMLPHADEDPIGRTYTEVWPPSEHFRGSWIIQRVMQTGNPVHFERYPQQFPDGSTRYYGVNLRRLLWEGQPVVLVVLWDVTEAEAAYQRIEQTVEEARASAAEAQEGREILEALLAYAPEGIAITNTQGQIRYISRYGKAMASVDNVDWQSITLEDQQDFWLLYHLDGLTPATTEELPITRVTRVHEIITNEEWIIKHPDRGLIYIACNAGPIRNQQGEMIGGLITWRDITERKQAADALEQYAARLEISNRELEQFASVASHDLQEPLRKIQAFSDILVRQNDDQGLTEYSREILGRMMDASQRMQRMISDLLTFSRVSTQARPPEYIHLQAVVDDVLDDLEARIHSTHGQVQVGELPSVYADPLQMRQLFQNLISNALKYHRPDADPLVKVYGRSISVTGQREKKMVQILVEDNGIGFDPQYLERIFKPFERLHGRSEYEGTGMGLAICQKIVERHHGAITATSQPNAGATFIVTLPIEAE